MLKMFRDRENGLCGGTCRDSAQISRHLEKADTETLVDELMELTERAANGDVNLEQIDAYLDALDEKNPHTCDREEIRSVCREGMEYPGRRSDEGSRDGN